MDTCVDSLYHFFLFSRLATFSRPNSFPGNDIKDLTVHEGEYESAPASAPPAPAPKPAPKPVPKSAPKSDAAPSRAPAASQGRGAGRGQGSGGGRWVQGRGSGGRGLNGTRPPNGNAGEGGRGSYPPHSSGRPRPAAGTGEALLGMKVRGGSASDATVKKEKVGTDFDFEKQQTVFSKMEDLAESLPEVSQYNKDDFFDSLSNDIQDRAEGR